VAVRRATGFACKSDASLLQSFAAFAAARGESYVRGPTAIAWAGLAQQLPQRARRLGIVRRFSRSLRAEDARHAIPPAVFGAARRPRPGPDLLSPDQVRRLIAAAARAGYRTLRRATYRTLFALLACTGRRVAEALRLRLVDLTPDGLVIRASTFRTRRLVPLHPTARAGLARYLEQRGPYAPAADPLFVSLRRTPLGLTDGATAFRTAARASGRPAGPGRPRPTPHSWRHTFAVRALQACPDGRDAIARHMVARSTDPRPRQGRRHLLVPGSRAGADA
jgi:integrase